MTWWIKGALLAGFISAFVGLWWMDRQQRYDAGYTAAELKYTKASQEALEESLSAKLDTLGQSIEESRKHAQTATQKATELSEFMGTMQVTLDDIEEWKNVDVEAECRDLGPDFLRLFNQPVQEGRSFIERRED